MKAPLLSTKYSITRIIIWNIFIKKNLFFFVKTLLKGTILGKSIICLRWAQNIWVSCRGLILLERKSHNFWR